MSHFLTRSKGASRSPFSLLSPPTKRTVIAYGIAFAIALSWLLPNHYHPWIAFHSDIYMAAGLWLILAWQCIESGNQRVSVSHSALALLFLSALCLLQYFAGLTYFHGEAVIAGMYFFGAFLAVVLGAEFAARRTDLSRKTFVALLGSMLVAGVVSAGVSLYQFFSLSYLGIWIIPTMSERLSANMGQPNQLATLISCAICVSIWLHERRALGLKVLLILVAWLLIGATLAQSRTGYLQLVIIALAWCVLPSRTHPLRRIVIVGLLAGCFFAIPLLLSFAA
jgi:hypothetical protein